MYIPLSALTISLFAHFASADINFTSPSAGQTISGTTIDVEFADGSGTPSVSEFTSYTLQLCAGGNTEGSYVPIATFTSNGDISSASYTATITDTTIGGSTTNAYFLRTLGVVPGGIVINFSDRFTLSSMTGQFSAAVQSSLASISGTSGPPTENQVQAAGTASAAGTVAEGSFALPYTMQTGPIRYAPMAKPAPTKITVKGGASAQYPTSVWTVWQRSGNAQPVAQTTQTEAYTYITASTYATMAAASQPVDDMQKFLNRWKD